VKDTVGQFGLEVHLGCTNMPNSKSNTEAMYFPAHSKPIEETEEVWCNGVLFLLEWMLRQSFLSSDRN
jgi:hypothetical protein